MKLSISSVQRYASNLNTTLESLRLAQENFREVMKETDFKTLMKNQNFTSISRNSSRRSSHENVCFTGSLWL